MMCLVYQLFSYFYKVYSRIKWPIYFLYEFILFEKAEKKKIFSSQSLQELEKRLRQSFLNKKLFSIIFFFF